MPKVTETHEIQYDRDELKGIIVQHLQREGYTVNKNEIDFDLRVRFGTGWPANEAPVPIFEGVTVKRAVKFVK